MALPKIEGQEHKGTRLENVERNSKNVAILLKVNNSDGCKRSPPGPTFPKGKPLNFHFLTYLIENTKFTWNTQS